MSKHNYSQYSKNERTERKEFDKKHKSVEVVEPIELVEETVDTVTIPETVAGTVSYCTRLNIRVAPNAYADVACIVDVDSTLSIDPAKSTSEWFSVCTPTGIEGYCMRKFVTAHL